MYGQPPPPQQPQPTYSAAPAQPSGPVVIANVYTLLSKESAPSRIGNDVLDVIGMSVYHTGIEIFGQEYSFGLDPAGRPDPTIDGIFVVPPRKAVGDFKEAVTLGVLPPNFTQANVSAVLTQLRPLWKAVTYHILNRNCCHFARDFAIALNPEFEKTFPSYVCRAANVGNAVIPDALVAKITDMVAPPPAVPPNLVNVIDFTWQGPIPPSPAGRQYQPASPQPAAAAPTAQRGPMGLFQSAGLALISGARIAATVVSDTVGTLVVESDRRNYAAKFPSNNPSLLRKTYTTSIVYLLREYEATLFIAADCIALCGPPQLQLVIPLSDIVAMQHARFIPPPAPRLPPSFEPVAAPVAENPCILLFRRSRPGLTTPVFNVRTFGSGVSETVSKVVGAEYKTVTQDAYAMIEELWLAGGRGSIN